MKRPDSVRCENCMFAAPCDEREGYAFTCHFNPPILDPTADGPGWPLVNGRSWCGQFVPLQNLDAVEWIAWKKGLLEDARTADL